MPDLLESLTCLAEVVCTTCPPMAHTRYIAGSQSALKSRIAELENAQTLSTTDVDRLRARIDNVEREKCDLAGVISLRLKQENKSRDGMDDVNCSSVVLTSL